MFAHFTQSSMVYAKGRITNKRSLNARARFVAASIDETQLESVLAGCVDGSFNERCRKKTECKSAKDE
jgi:hypothetical protein